MFIITFSFLECACFCLKVLTNIFRGLFFQYEMAEVGGSYQPALTKKQEDELRSIAAKILQPGKGILGEL